MSAMSFMCGALLVAALPVVIASTIAPAPARADPLISIKWGKTVVGSGKTVEVVRPLPAFDQVEARDGIRVVLREAATQKVTIKADDNIEPLIETTVENNTLMVKPRSKTSMRTQNTMIVMIDYVQLKSLAVNDGVSADLDAAKGALFSARVRDGSSLKIANVSANDMELKVRDGASATIEKVSGARAHTYTVADAGNLKVFALSGGQVSAVVSDGAKISVSGVALRLLDIKVSDGASANAQGSAQQQNFRVSDGASADMEGLSGQTARAFATDGSSLKIGKVQTLDVDVSDGSTVRYGGEPVLTQNVRDGGRLKRL